MNAFSSFSQVPKNMMVAVEGNFLIGTLGRSAKKTVAEVGGGDVKSGNPPPGEGVAVLSTFLWIGVKS
jgi:hypothetical protein